MPQVGQKMKSNYLDTLSKNLTGFLVGFLLLSCAIFREQMFFLHGLLIAYLYGLFIFFGVGLSAFFLSRLLKLKGRYGIIVVVFVEILLGVLLRTVIMSQVNMPIVGVFLKKLYFRNAIQFDPKLSQYDTRLGYLYRPNVSASYNLWEFKSFISTNKAGLRDDSASLNNPNIITIGDSYTTGWGVEQQETYAQLIEKRLNKKVLNAGISSFGTIREGVLLSQLDKDSCEWVIVQYCGNDFLENKTCADAMLMGKPFIPKINKANYQNSSIQDGVQATYTPFRFIFELLKAFFFKLLRIEREQDSYKDTSTIPLQVTYFLKSLEVIQRSYKGKILIITLSSPRSDSTFVAQAEAQNTKLRLPNTYFLNAGKYFKSTDSFILDGHLNKSGHAKVSSEIVKFLINFERNHQ